MFEVVRQSLRDVVYARGVSPHERYVAIEYLRGDMPHAELCGVDSDYIKRVIKSVGLEL